jgi:enamine deaminase RidA (YjgF/YER057c/UK114 family)
MNRAYVFPASCDRLSRRMLLRGGLAAALATAGPALAQSSPEEAALEAKLKEMGIVLPPPPQPVANYVPAVLEGNLLFVAGMLPTADGKLAYRGTVPTTISIDDARAAARLCAINILAAAKGALGQLSRVKRTVRVEGFVASADDFTQQPSVMNAASEVFGGLWGDAGKHARFAIGVNVLPLGAPVEIAAVLAVK